MSGLSGLLGNQKTRSLVILGGVVFSVVVFAVVVFTGGDKLAEQSSTAAEIPTHIESTPGGELPERYRDLQVEENKARADEAAKTGESAIPTIVGSLKKYDFELPNFENEKPADLIKDIAKDTKPKLKKVVPKRSINELLNPNRDNRTNKRLEAKEKRAAQVKEARASRKSDKQLQKRVGEMDKQFKNIMSAWTKFTPQVYVGPDLESTADGENVGTGGNSAGSSANGGAGGSGAAGGAATPVPGTVIKSGDIYFAVLDTAINTDEQGPILATVVQGKYRGARLVGTIEHPPGGQKVVLRFNVMNVPGRDASVAVDTVAIDPDTARTALGSDVDNHYLLRYGSLFAAAFLEGYGDVIKNAGSTTTNILGGSVTTTPPLSTREEIYSALGDVGKAWGKRLDSFDRQPTVTVNQGTSFALLFLGDVTIPDKNS